MLEKLAVDLFGGQNLFLITKTIRSSVQTMLNCRDYFRRGERLLALSQAGFGKG
jgi:hypothetical protein